MPMVYKSMLMYVHTCHMTPTVSEQTNVCMYMSLILFLSNIQMQCFQSCRHNNWTLWWLLTPFHVNCPPPALLQPVSILNVHLRTSYWQRLSIKPVLSRTRNLGSVATPIWVLTAYLSIFEIYHSSPAEIWVYPSMFDKVFFLTWFL